MKHFIPLRKTVRSRSDKSGLPPGSLVYVGEERTGDITITCTSYDRATISCWQPVDPAECTPDPGKVLWLDMAGIHQPEMLARWGTAFGLHPLVLEDILNTEHRPKLEELESQLFFVLKAFKVSDDGTELVEDQVSLVLGQGYVLSFQEKGGEFAAVQGRLDQGKGRIRGSGADYLAYALIDSVVDRYFSVLEHIGQRIDDLQEKLLADPDQSCMAGIHAVKQDVLLVRKAVWPLRETLNAILRQDTDLVGEATRIYFRDVYDHTVQLLDTVETFRDMIAGMFDTYLSSVSLRMNEVMKVLTIMATIFIPLTFIVGLYGMNFQHMPELHWKWGYPAVLVFMAAIVALMFWYFKRRKWF